MSPPRWQILQSGRRLDADARDVREGLGVTFLNGRTGELVLIFETEVWITGPNLIRSVDNWTSRF